MKCIMLVTTEVGQQEAGTIKLRNGKITGHPVAGYQRLIREVLAQPNVIDRGTTTITASSDPARWLQALPDNYTGSYLRAELI